MGEQHQESPLQSEAPPTIAISMRPDCIARAATSIACNDEAQAELIARNGPVRPKALEIVPATMLAGNVRRVGTCGGAACREPRPTSCVDHGLLLIGRQGSEVIDLGEELGRLFDARGVGVFAAQIASLRVADEHARVPQRKIERVEARMPAGPRGHFAHQQMNGVDRLLQTSPESGTPCDRTAGWR